MYLKKRNKKGQFIGDKIEVNCDWCNKKIKIRQYQSKRFKHHFCNQKCHYNWEKKNALKGNNNLGWKKIKINCDFCGKEIEIIPFNLKKYKNHFCGQECHYKWIDKTGSLKGKNNPAYVDGKYYENLEKNAKIRRSKEMKLWRKACLIRDNFTCQKYETKSGILCVHHINNFADFPELRLAIDNGITLSEKAHREFHHLYGVKNNTKEQLIEFLNERTI